MTNAEVIARVRAVYKEEVLSRPSRPVLLEVPSGLLHRFKDAIWKPAATEPWVGEDIDQLLLAHVLADLVGATCPATRT